MLTFLRHISPTRLAIFLLLALTCYRFWFATQIGLVADEAYYWLWSKHLAASYRDKGPGIAWTIALGTHLFGDTVFGIRFFAVVFSTGALGLLFLLARRMYDERVALWCLLVANTMPMLAAGAILMTIDSLSVFFWALTALLLWNALHRNRAWDWLWMGLAIGAGFLAKFTNGVQLACIGLFLLWSREHRHLLFRRGMALLLAAFTLCTLPILWWNLQTGWVHAGALRSRSGVKDAFQIRPDEFFQFVGEQFGVVSPLFMAGMVAAAVGLGWKQHRDLRIRFLLCQFAPLYALFLFFSLNKSGKANWTAPALITGIILTVVFWRAVVAQRPAWRWGVRAAFAIALVMTAVLHNTEFLRLPPKLDILHRAQGWPDFAARVQRVRDTHRANVLIGSHYACASLMAFYLPDRPTTYLPPGKIGGSQFALWPTYAVTPATRALFVAWSYQSIPESLRAQFSRIEEVEDFWSQHHGRPMNHFKVYLCTPD